MSNNAIVDIVDTIQKLSASERAGDHFKVVSGCCASRQGYEFQSSSLSGRVQSSKINALQEIKAMAARHNIELPANEPVDLTKLNKQLDEQNLDRQDRMVLKGMLFRAGLCEA
jgi:hypothetical protein